MDTTKTSDTSSIISSISSSSSGHSISGTSARAQKLRDSVRTVLELRECEVSARKGYVHKDIRISVLSSCAMLLCGVKKLLQRWAGAPTAPRSGGASEQKPEQEEGENCGSEKPLAPSISFALDTPAHSDPVLVLVLALDDTLFTCRGPRAVGVPGGGVAVLYRIGGAQWSDDDGKNSTTKTVNSVWVASKSAEIDSLIREVCSATGDIPTLAPTSTSHSTLQFSSLWKQVMEVATASVTGPMSAHAVTRNNAEFTTVSLLWKQ